MGRVAATFASTLCLLIGMTSLAIGKDGRGDDDRDDRHDGGIERIEKHIIGKVLRSDYDGLSDDLLTVGLGATGLAGAAPAVATAALRGKPTIIVHGRSDALLPVNHTSRSYYGSALRKQQNIRYYEVTNAHHLDAFNGFPVFNAAFIPLHVYFIEGLDRLYAHLKNGKALPPSQVVHTIPRGVGPVGTLPITAANVPPIADADKVAEGDRITFTGSVLRIPD